MQSDEAAPPKMRAGTGVFVLVAVFNLAAAFLISWITDRYFQGNCFEHLRTVLEPSWNAVRTGVMFAPVFMVLSTVLPYIRKKVLNLPTQTLNDFVEPAGVLDCAVYATASTISDGILYRGVIQHLGGIWCANALFALMHFSGWKSLPYVAATFVYGISLSGIYAYSGNLWTPITASLLVNFVSFMLHSYAHRQMMN